MNSAATVSAPATTPSTMNGARIPNSEPSTPPNTGPIRMPAVPAPVAVPSTRPRRSGGFTVISHASAAVHEIADAAPCSPRAAISAQKSLPNAYAGVDTAISPTPTIVSRRGPNRSASHPTGNDNTSTTML